MKFKSRTDTNLHQLQQPWHSSTFSENFWYGNIIFGVFQELAKGHELLDKPNTKSMGLNQGSLHVTGLGSDFYIKLADSLDSDLSFESGWDNNYSCVNFCEFTKWQQFTIKMVLGEKKSCHLEWKYCISLMSGDIK